MAFHFSAMQVSEKEMAFIANCKLDSIVDAVRRVLVSVANCRQPTATQLQQRVSRVYFRY